MSTWSTYPPTYRSAEVQAVLPALQAGECVSIVGLSGAGKSNLLGYLANTQSTPQHALVLIDCNRLPNYTPTALLHRLYAAVAEPGAEPFADDLDQLERLLTRRLAAPNQALTFLLDRYETLAAHEALAGNLRALRDAHKFQLTFVTATRRPLPAYTATHTEFSELFYAHTFWLGPLSESDARWNVARYAERRGAAWSEAATQKIVALSGGYAALLRAVCEAHAAGAELDLAALAAHPAVSRRVAEFWTDQPTDEELCQSRLKPITLLMTGHAPAIDTTQLTAKEHLLLSYLQAHAEAVCAKDDLIRAVWPEDKVFQHGVRDDSLAQLVRRLREKIEPDSANPCHIQTVAGRGYRYKN